MLTLRRRSDKNIGSRLWQSITGPAVIAAAFNGTMVVAESKSVDQAVKYFSALSENAANQESILISGIHFRPSK